MRLRVGVRRAQRPGHVGGQVRQAALRRRVPGGAEMTLQPGPQQGITGVRVGRGGTGCTKRLIDRLLALLGGVRRR
ncbi:hypothetical protein GCM10027614_09780 [Micromonospora vulcania]